MENKSKLRRLQAWSANRNWRIDYIFYPEDKGILVTGIKNPMGFISIVGVFLFLGGFTYLMIKKGEVDSIAVPISMCLFGFVMAASGSIFHEKIRKRNWPTLRSECLDYELQFGRTANNHHIWALRALCRFEINQQEITCTPEISWSKRKGEGWKTRYIGKESNGADFCTLLVNPDNPHEIQFINLE